MDYAQAVDPNQGMVKSASPGVQSHLTINDAFSRIDKSLALVEDQFELIINRVTPILSDSYPTDPGSAEKEPGGNSDVFNYLTGIAQRLEALYYRMNSANQRIQL